MKNFYLMEILNWYFKDGMLNGDVDLLSDENKNYKFMSMINVKYLNDKLDGCTIQQIKEFKIITRKGTTLILKMNKMDKWYFKNDLSNQYQNILNCQDFHTNDNEYKFT